MYHWQRPVAATGPGAGTEKGCFMLGIGTSEFLVIIVVAILVLGPEHLPRVLRTVQKVMSDFRRISTDFQRAVNLEAHLEDLSGPSTAKKTTTKKKKKPAAQPADPETPKKPTETPPSQTAETPSAPVEEQAAQKPDGVA